MLKDGLLIYLTLAAPPPHPIPIRLGSYMDFVLFPYQIRNCMDLNAIIQKPDKYWSEREMYIWVNAIVCWTKSWNCAPYTQFIQSKKWCIFKKNFKPIWYVACFSVGSHLMKHITAFYKVHRNLADISFVRERF